MASTTGYIGCQFGIEPSSAIQDPAPFAGEEFLGHDSKYTTVPHPRTGNTIKGFQWDRRIWSKEETENWDSFVEPIFDPSTDEISTSYFQSGIGDNTDLKLIDIVEAECSGLYQPEMFHPWVPVVEHGFFYDFDQEYFLFSDASKKAYASYSGVAGAGSGLANDFNIIALNEYLKAGIPVKATQWEYDQDTGEYSPSLDFKKKSAFTGERDDVTLIRKETFNEDGPYIYFNNIDKTDPEFMVVYSGAVPSGVSTPYPTIVLNDQYVQQVGAGDIPQDLDLLGITQGTGVEIFNTTYSPIDKTMGVDVFTYISTNAAVSGQYLQWQGVSDEVDPMGLQVAVDYDLGIIRFGDPACSGEGQVTPSGGHYVGARYWKSVEVEYEPDQSTDLATGIETNINPIYRKGSQGFVYLSPRDDNPASIVLTAEERLVTTNEYGPVYIGISYIPIIATVYNERGQVLEDQTVYFDITSTPIMGAFSGGESSSVGVTDQNGEALAFYRPPSSIEDISEVCTENEMTVNNAPVVPSGATQTVTFRLDELALRGTETEIFLYDVMRDDLIQGDYDSSVGDTTTEQTAEYYRQYFVEHGLYGPTGLQVGTTTVSSNAIAWEAMRRMLWDLRRPTIFGVGSGRKRIVAFLDSNALNPHTFTSGAVYPFQPAVVESLTNGEFDVIFDTSVNSLTLPTGTSDLYGYMLVGPTLVKMQAYAYNTRLRRNIYSNEIQINIDIPPYAKGVWEVELLNTVTDDEISPLLTSAMEGKMVPFGWRIRSTNITLAAAIDAVTFLDKNQTYNADLWDLDTATPLWNQFEVAEIV